MASWTNKANFFVPKVLSYAYFKFGKFDFDKN